MPVGRHAVDRRVLVHRRDHDAVRQRHAAQPERLEHRHGRLDHINVEAWLAHVVRHQLVELGDELRRAQREIVVGDRLGARHQTEREAPRVHVPEAAHLLEPDQRHIGGMLGLLDFERAARFRKCASARLTSRPPVCLERIEQRDRVFHRELGARADREMRGRLGVADQHDVAVRPVLAADGREVAPERAVDRSACGRQAPRRTRLRGISPTAASSSLSSPARANVSGSVSITQVE